MSHKLKEEKNVRSESHQVLTHRVVACGRHFHCRDLHVDCYLAVRLDLAHRPDATLPSEVHDDSGVNQYAQRIISTPGKHDGLAWRNPDGSEGGPIGEAVAKAIEEGYTNKSEPYHGYHFKTLKGQGPTAPLGKLDYIVNGAMIGGFALVAWPAEYRVSGVQTFIVSYDGVVYQKDLGPDTSKLAEAMERYNPDKTWHPTNDEQ